VAQQVHKRERNAFPERRKDAPRAIWSRLRIQGHA
jgi:hypothetical protein